MKPQDKKKYGMRTDPKTGKSYYMVPVEQEDGSRHPHAFVNVLACSCSDPTLHREVWSLDRYQRTRAAQQLKRQVNEKRLHRDKNGFYTDDSETD